MGLCQWQTGFDLFGDGVRYRLWLVTSFMGLAMIVIEWLLDGDDNDNVVARALSLVLFWAFQKGLME